jgi:hypothetical protein
MDDHLERNTGTVRDRRLFFAALGFFLLWVAALGALAVLSGRRPAPSPTTFQDR